MNRPGRVRRLPPAALAAIAAACIATAGCRTTQRDSELRRQETRARIAYAEGDDLTAIDRYRLAVFRAWAIDDADEVGHAAYNLAAALASTGCYGEARDWLCEARAGLRFAGRPEHNAWLLEAQIARLQGMPFEAAAIADHAAQLIACQSTDGHAQSAVYHQHGAEQPGGRQAAHRRPCAAEDECRREGRGRWSERLLKTEKMKCEQQVRQRELAARAEVELLRADIACDLGDLDLAAVYLTRAEGLLVDVEDRTVHAHLERTAGRRLMLAMEPRAAAERFDREAFHSRAAELYREIPAAYVAAGEAYEMVGMLSAAADRYQRAARMSFVQELYTPALLLIERAVRLAEATGDREIEGRLAVLFGEVSQAVRQSAPSGERAQPPPSTEPAPVQAAPEQVPGAPSSESLILPNADPRTSTLPPKSASPGGVPRGAPPQGVQLRAPGGAAVGPPPRDWHARLRAMVERAGAPWPEPRTAVPTTAAHSPQFPVESHQSASPPQPVLR